jgi:hypothetical protein
VWREAESAPVRVELADWYMRWLFRSGFASKVKEAGAVPGVRVWAEKVGTVSRSEEIMPGLCWDVSGRVIVEEGDGHTPPCSRGTEGATREWNSPETESGFLEALMVVL